MDVHARGTLPLLPLSPLASHTSSTSFPAVVCRRSSAVGSLGEGGAAATSPPAIVPLLLPPCLPHSLPFHPTPPLIAQGQLSAAQQEAALLRADSSVAAGRAASLEQQLATARADADGWRAKA
eukprot:141616-Chlamydomonas_euryale.AAC.1